METSDWRNEILKLNLAASGSTRNDALDQTRGCSTCLLRTSGYVLYFRNRNRECPKFVRSISIDFVS